MISGYVYDFETELYYLQSRYYNPEVGRFLNADAYASTGQGLLGNNMFAYCNNSPVTRTDPTGQAWFEIVIMCVSLALLVGCSASSSSDSVTVLGSAEWESSSNTMGKKLAGALGSKHSTTKTVNSSNFSETWNEITSNYAVIHTHGSSAVLFGDGKTILNYSDTANLSFNSDIDYLIITACSVGGSPENGATMNMGQLLSTKISGYVLCSTTTVSGTDDSFRALHGGQWDVYKNGVLIDSLGSDTITWGSVVEYIQNDLR